MDYHLLEDTHKKAAARRAAAKYATEPPHALREYIRLSGIIDLLPDAYKEYPPYKHYIENGEKAEAAHTVAIWVSDKDYFEELKKTNPAHAESAQIYADANKEMLSLLPKYRHPVNDIFAESMIFFAGGLESTMIGITWTPLMEEVKESIPEPMRSKLLQELKALESTKVKLNIITAERDDVLNTLDNARREYQQKFEGEPTNARQKRVVRKLGFSNAKRPKTFNPGTLYQDYVKLVRRKNFNRHDAVNKVANLHRIAPGTALKELHKVRAFIKKRIKKENTPELQQTFLSYLVDLIPNNR